MVNGHVDRLLQKRHIYKDREKLFLSKDETDKFHGLVAASDYEAAQLVKCVEATLNANKIKLSPEATQLVIDNIIELSIVLISESFEHTNSDILKKDIYNKVISIIAAEVGEDNTSEIFEDISKVISETKFAKHIAGAQLFISLLNTDSSQLIGALGGTESVNVYLDASVAIPLLCGVIFSSSKDRVGNSGRILHEMIKEHEFNAIIPSVYLEEISAHLIEACRDYKYILNIGEDLSYSGNAFISHYSSYNKIMISKSISFDDYVKISG